MIAWARDFLHRRKHIIRLRMPQSMTLITGSNRESISATYDEGGRLVHLTVHTRLRSLRDR
jgi:hypothetical protein